MLIQIIFISTAFESVWQIGKDTEGSYPSYSDSPSWKGLTPLPPACWEDQWLFDKVHRARLLWRVNGEV